MHKTKFFIDTNIRKSNRQKTLTPRKGKYWCHYCDCQLVSDYKKCPNCNRRNDRKRLKKEY